MKKVFITTTILLAAIFMNSCGEVKTNAQETKPAADSAAKPEATAKTEDQMVMDEAIAFYKSVSDGSFNGAVEFLHPKAVEATPKSEWLKLLEDTKARFGNLMKTNVIDSKKFDQVTTIVGKADYYQILFENTYKNGVLYEMLSFVKEQNSSKPRVLSYTYNSDKAKVTFEQF